jgi:hypothetical protein
MGRTTAPSSWLLALGGGCTVSLQPPVILLQRGGDAGQGRSTVSIRSRSAEKLGSAAASEVNAELRNATYGEAH